METILVVACENKSWDSILIHIGIRNESNVGSIFIGVISDKFVNSYWDSYPYDVTEDDLVALGWRSKALHSVRGHDKIRK